MRASPITNHVVTHMEKLSVKKGLLKLNRISDKFMSEPYNLD